jgi:predicted HAD superfamily Cof-like phosphohydrolase
MTNFEMVKEFHRVFGLTLNDSPTTISWDDAELRYKLMEEEFSEVVAEVFEDEDDISSIPSHLSKVAKELADLLYVTYGTAATYGIDIDKVFTEVHRSNMSKLTADGKVLRREDGKVLKSDQYSPANVEAILFG